MDIKISFEFFPPTSKAVEKKLELNFKKLSGLNPSFVSITYGAGGSTRERTHNLIKKIMTQTSLNVAAHLTCVNASRSDVKSVINGYLNIGVKHIVALRGDMSDLSAFKPHPKGFKNSIELVDYIKSKDNIRVSVSGYPEPHPESISHELDMEFLKTKIDSGADQIITQYCLNTDYYLRYRDHLDKENIHIPILPGIMMIKSFSGIEKMSRKIGVEVPSEISEIIEKKLSVKEEKIFAEEYARKQCERLIKNGFKNLHFYTLNESDNVINVAKKIGLKNDEN